jgi:hypothetical protein
MKWANWGFVILLLAPARVAVAQQQSTQQEDPVAAAARRAREQKQQQAKPLKVWDNDNIPKRPGALNVIGQAVPENEPATADSSASTENKPADSGTGKKVVLTAAEQKSVIETDLAAAKEQLQTLQNDLDILQRKYTLDQQMYYSKPDYASDKAGAASLQDEQDQIDAKQQEMIAAQQKIADLQAKLNATNPGASSDSKNNSQ